MDRADRSRAQESLRSTSGRASVGALKTAAAVRADTAHTGGWTASDAANRWRAAGLDRKLRAQVLPAAISDPMIRDVRRIHAGALPWTD